MSTETTIKIKLPSYTDHQISSNSVTLFRRNQITSQYKFEEKKIRDTVGINVTVYDKHELERKTY